MPERIPFGEAEKCALTTLKQLLCKATVDALDVIDMSGPFNVFVNSSEYCVGGCLSQTSDTGNEMPVAFASSKLTQTQQNWDIIEKESYACLWVLHKFKHWIFG